MTAAGLALIAGGLATLISFRAVLFGSADQGRGARRRQARALEAPKQRPALTAAAEEPVVPEPEPELEPALELVEADPEPVHDEPTRSRRGRRGRRRALVPSSDEQPQPAVPSWSDEDDRGGLASIGLADEDLDRVTTDVIAEDAIAVPEQLEASDGPGPDEGAEPGESEPEPVRGRRSDHYGDRVAGWVRPEYHEPAAEPRPGEYWTPIPVDLAGDAEPSAKGYGWPRPVERLPAVPDYEPATGFDMIPISEPTEAMPSWPMNDERPGRIRLPRSWSARNEKPPRRDEMPPIERRRPRPRPRPDPPVDRSTTVYVSRHAAEPPPRPPA
jgi:hypothetical protein